MIQDHLLETKIVRCKNAVGAGTGDDQDGSTIDTQGYDGVEFVAILGAIASGGVATLKSMSGDASNGSDAAEVTGANVAIVADTDDNKMLRLNVIRPLKRYVTPRLTRATGNVTIDGIIAILYRAKKLSNTQDSTVANSKTVVGL